MIRRLPRSSNAARLIPQSVSNLKVILPHVARITVHVRLTLVKWKLIECAIS